MADKTLGFVRQKWDMAQAPLLSELRSYWLNHSFLLGHQWLTKQKNDVVEPVPEDSDRIKAKDNRMRANMRTLNSNILQRPLQLEVSPDAADDQTIKAARLAEAIVENTRIDHKWESLRESLVAAAMKGGTSALVIDWDEAAKDSIEEVTSIAEMGVEPGAPVAEFATWWVRAQLLPVDTVAHRFPEYYKDGVKPAANTGAALSSFGSRMLTVGTGGDGPTASLALVLTYYERPNPTNPEGRVVVEVDNETVLETAWNFPWKDRLNFSVMRETVVENQWYGASFLDDVRPLQVMLNLVWSNLMEHLAEAGTARMLMPSSGADMVRRIRDIPGEVLEYPDGVAKPEYMSPPQLTNWIQELPARLESSIDDIMGIHDVSRGQAPANIESGYGLSILAERDSSPVGKIINETVAVFSDIATMHLQLVEQEVKDRRKTSVRLATGPERHEWTGADLHGQVRAFVPADAIVPRSRVASQAFADKAMEMKLITNLRQYAMLAELPGSRGLVDSASPQIGKAIRENEGFGLREIKIPAEFDDHAAHIEVHNEFRSSQRYEEMSEQEQNDVNLHVAAHENLAAEAMGKMVQRQNLDPNLAAVPTSTGSPPPPFPPPPPQEASPAQADVGPPPPEATATAELPPELLNPEAVTQDIVQSLDGTS